MNKLSRDAFLYLNPEPDVADFAQCSSCQDWVEGDNRCVIHGPRVRTPGSASCGFYIFGDPEPAGTTTYPVVSAEESGLVDRQVRCENCQWGGPSTYKCRFFMGLNERLPEMFDLDEQIEPKDAAMLNSLEKPKPTDEQVAICDYIRKEKGNLQINALAGGGKTSTVEMMMAGGREPTLYLAFNKDVVKEAKERLPSGVEIRTFNSMGFECWKKGNGKADVNLKKTNELLKAIIYEYKGSDRTEISDAWWDITGAIHMAKHLGYIPEGKFPSARRLCTQSELCSRIENRLSPLCLEVVNNVLFASIKAAYAGAIDLDDQIYMPALFGGSYKRFPLIYVDERQDLSPTNVALLERLIPKVTGRLVEVGDRWQAIYAFRGAETDGMRQSKAKFSMHEMPLSFSFRCPEAIVRAVHWHVPHMRWIKSGGTYEELQTLNPTDIPDGAAIICRNNAPLFRAAFALLSNKRSVQVAGSDIGPKLLRLLAKVGTSGDSSEDLILKIDGWTDDQLQTTNSPTTILDQAECMKVFASWGNTYDQAVGYAKHIFGQQGTIKLTTGHKAKGAEWNTVYHLDKHLLSKEEQDLNLKYVITTRAKQELFEITTKELQW